MADAHQACCVFDAYGTVFDVHSAVSRNASSLGDVAEAFSNFWRTKQLEYAWVSSLSCRHVDFWQLTCDALDHALAVCALRVPGLRDSLLRSYRTLDVYGDVPPALAGLRGLGVRTAILSNGSPDMLGDAISAGGVAGLFDAVLSIEEVGIYKPSPAAYALVTDRLNLLPGDVTFLSSNAWDVMGAGAFGFEARWVNRARRPPEYRLLNPALELSSLKELPGLIAQSRTPPVSVDGRRITA